MWLAEEPGGADVASHGAAFTGGAILPLYGHLLVGPESNCVPVNIFDNVVAERHRFKYSFRCHGEMVIL